MKQGRLNIGLIGSDVVGVAIAQALQGAGHLVIGIAKAQQSDELSALLPTVKFLSTEELLDQADLILLAVAAVEISATVSDLVDSGRLRGGQIIVHLAPGFNLEILKPATMLGLIPLAIHPAMAFTGTSMDLKRIKESYFAVSAPAVALPIAQALVIEMGAEPLIIDDSQRASYAEAIEVAGNFSAMIVNQAIGLLLQAGVENASAVIAPVIESAVDQALSKGHKKIDSEDLIGDS